VGRDSFKREFGNEASSDWERVGLINTISIGRSEREVVGLLRSFKGFLEANPTFESENIGITAEEAGTLLTQLETARGAVQLQLKQTTDLMADRDSKLVVLRKTMRDMINELMIRLDPMSSIWLAFGLNQPGVLATPDAPENISAVLVGPTAAAVKWDGAPRAEYYRVWKKVVGVDEDFEAAGTPADLDFALEGLPLNAQIQIAVTAVNNGGESAQSEIITITTH
jgi:hypothetical protein